MTNPSPPQVGEHTLPSGATVTLGDPEDFTGDDLQDVLAATGLTLDQLDTPAVATVQSGFGVARAVAAKLVTAWTVPYLPDAPPPAQDPTQVGRLRARDYAALLTLCAPAVRLFLGGDEAATPDDADTPGSPTGPAGD